MSLCLLLFVGVTLGSARLAARPDTARTEAVLFICQLNPDCLADTVIAVDDSLHHNGLFLPARIAWGVPTAADGGCTDTVGGAIAPLARRAVTYLRYPTTWTRLAGSSSVMRADSDAYDDLLVMLWGKSAVGNDTAVSVCVFGQHSLNTFDTIDVGAVAVVQHTPFYARHLGLGTDFVDGSLRDFTDDTSYVLRALPSAADAGEHSVTVSAGVDASARTGLKGPDVRLFPNPTHASARIEAAPLVAGDYEITVIAGDGRQAAMYRMAVGAGGILSCVLDFTRLASGAYVVRIAGSGGVVGAYPITVTH